MMSFFVICFQRAEHDLASLRDLTISWLHLRCADELDACASEIRRSGGLKASTIGMDTVEFFS